MPVIAVISVASALGRTDLYQLWLIRLNPSATADWAPRRVWRRLLSVQMAAHWWSQKKQPACSILMRWWMDWRARQLHMHLRVQYHSVSPSTGMDMRSSRKHQDRFPPIRLMTVDSV